MTPQDEETLAELLLRWEELHEQGQEVSSVELCQNCPHLADELGQRIHALKMTAWLDKPLGNTEFDQVLTSTISHQQHRTLVGRYRLDDLIAEGGFAQVWRAYDLELHRSVAVKVPKPSRLDSADSFMAEARRVARLKHPGIVPVHDVGREDGTCFIVSEFVEGGNLANQIAKSPVSSEQAIRWTAEIAEALEYAHAIGVIHRDIKPANILIDHHGRALLADFGIAQSATKTGRFAPSIGTLRYMAPEQLEGKAVDARSDIYSLGVVLHELLTGSLPYSSDEPNVLRQEIVSGAKFGLNNLPIEVRRICFKALDRDPANRHQSAKSFADELRNVFQKFRGRHFLSSVLVVAVVFGVGGFAIWRLNQKAALQMNPTQAHSTLEPLDPQWIDRIAELSVDEQISEVVAKLKELNPTFDGQVKSGQLNGVVNQIDFRSDNVTDVRPLAALKKLQYVNLSGSFNWKHNGQLMDISPLRGLPLEEVDVHSSLVKDISPLENAPLKVLVLNNTGVTNLTPIRHSKLVVLDIHNTFIADLTPIQGMPLTNLHMANTQVKDLSPLAGMPLNDLRCQYCGFTDISPLQGMPLHSLECHGNPITDLSPLTNSPVCNLNIYKTPITDWSALRSMPRLRMIGMDFDKSRDAEILQSITTLEEINKQSVQDFWRTVEKPTTAPEAYAVGELYLKAQNTGKALQYYSLAIELDSKCAKAYCKRGECLFTDERYNESLADFSKAVELEPSNPIFLERMANACFHLRRFDEAIQTMEKAIATAPPEADRYKQSLAIMLSNRAAQSSFTKNFSEAIADLTRAIELDPNGLYFHRQRASCYFNNKEYEKAAADFTEAIKREPNKGAHYLNRGYCLQALGKNEEAALDFEKAKSLGESQ